ncbi:protein kinase [Phormidium yuhuli AB48]|uniref:non-specific serine/threonine protein kinase n=1 Tax=Phormidium yuhuli AB48 TaxID=2940671 RepID=A0ABY5AP52_9CYAN|nr:protein kinase [Phormidium yuhuli]USR89943.1 protein kinase [Phormidium yuhuli AB48]
MTFCLNPDCPQPQNSRNASICATCGSPLLVGDRYRPLRAIGTGGFGRTFLGVDEYKPSKPPCVIKQFNPREQGTQNRDRAADLFLQEANRLDELGSHPQIPHLLAHFQWNQHQYLIQEFINGSNLEEELEMSGCLSDDEIRQLLRDLLPVLQFVHDHKVIHRDVKPANLIRSQNGQLYLVDFGASKLATAANLALTGTRIGSAGYAAPEQAMGKGTFASDIYSLGVTCIHLLTGISPFDLYDSNDGKLRWQDYLDQGRRVDPHLIKVLDKMVETATGRRYRSPAAILSDLNHPRPRYRPEGAVPSVASVTTDSPGPSRPLFQEGDSGSALSKVESTPAYEARVRTSYFLWLVAFLLGSGFRPLKGLHRFYNGKIFTGFLWMIPVIGDIGGFVDLFLIPEMAQEREEEIRARMGVSSSGVPMMPHTSVTQVWTPASQDEQVMTLLKEAERKGGQLTVTQAVMATGLSFDKAERLLMELAKTGYVEVDNDVSTGAVVYRFRELSS